MKKIGKFVKGTVVGTRTKLTPENKSKIDKLAEEGLNARQIALEIGNINPNTVGSYLKASGKYVKGHRYKTPEQIRAEKPNQPILNTESLRNELLLAVKKLAKKYKCSTEDVLATLNSKE